MQGIKTAQMGLAILALGLVLASCSSRQPPAPSEPVKKYQLNGQVTSVDPTTLTAKIHGERIEGWMESMTMDYPVKDPSEFKKLSAGESITATVFVQGTDFWLGEITPASPPEKK